MNHPIVLRPAPRCGAAVAALILAVALALCLFGPAQAAAPESFPPLTGRVVDTAGMIDPAGEQALTEKLAAFEQKSSDQIAIATVPDLGGDDIADYANRLARHWALGRKGEDNGVLLLVSKGDRKVRIEVGYGLEGTLTDALSKLIVENDILPAFRTGDFAGGIAKGVDGILQVLSGNAAELQARAKRNEGWQASGETVFNAIFVGIVLLFIVGPFILAALGHGAGRRSRYRRGGMIVPMGWGGGGGWGRGGGSWGGGGGGFSGGGGSFGGGGASGGW